MKSFAERLLGALDWIEKYLVVFFCAGIVLLIFFGVLSRFVFHYSIAWSEELARYFFLWGALFGAAAACKTGQHGGIPLLVDRFSPGARRIVEWLVVVGMVGFLGYLAWQSYGTTMRALGSGQKSMTTHIPVWVVNGGMLLAFVLAVVRTLQGFLRGAYRADQATVE